MRDSRVAYGGATPNDSVTCCYKIEVVFIAEAPPTLPYISLTLSTLSLMKPLRSIPPNLHYSPPGRVMFQKPSPIRAQITSNYCFVNSFPPPYTCLRVDHERQKTHHIGLVGPHETLPAHLGTMVKDGVETPLNCPVYAGMHQVSQARKNLARHGAQKVNIRRHSRKPPPLGTTQQLRTGKNTIDDMPRCRMRPQVKQRPSTTPFTGQTGPDQRGFAECLRIQVCVCGNATRDRRMKQGLGPVFYKRQALSAGCWNCREIREKEGDSSRTTPSGKLSPTRQQSSTRLRKLAYSAPRDKRHDGWLQEVAG